MNTRWILVAVTGSWLGCGGAPGTRPEDMSAARHQEAAQEHQAQADRQTDHSHATTAAGHIQHGVGPEVIVEHDPAGMHQEDAQAHAAAAAALERDLATACAGVAQPERSQCPFAGGATGATDVDSGVEIRLPAARGPDVERRARCHRAWMAVQGLEHMAACPLGVRGVSVSVAPGGALRIVTSEGDAAAAELRRRARAVPPPAAPTRGHEHR